MQHSFADRVRNALFEIARIVLTGGIVALIIVFVWDYVDRPTLETFRSEYIDASQHDRQAVAEKYLNLFSPAELVGELSKEYGEDVCHVQTHPIGRALYAKNQNFAESFRMCPNSCSYGCFHGVMMEMFSTDSDTLGGTIDDESPEKYLAHVRDEAVTLCSRPEVTSIAHPQYCTHGLGHVFALLAGHDLESAVASCGVLTSPAAIDSCTSGAFMEYLSNPETMNESLSHGQAPCDRFPEHTVACYRYKAYRWISGWDGVAPALKACGSFGANADACVEAVGRAAATEKMLVDKQKFDALCASVSGAARDTCVRGALMKLFDVNITDTEHACAKLDESYRDACAQTLVHFKQTVLYDR